MYCEKCGQQIPDDSKFCEFCGAPIRGIEKSKVVEPDLPIEEPIVKKVKPIQTIKEPKPKPKSKLLFIIMLLILVGVGGYFVLNFLGMGDLITNLPNLILGKSDASEVPTRDDFNWYVPMSYDEVPTDGTQLMYEDILGEWKIMVVNYISVPEETYFSTVDLKENASSEFNTTLDFTHHYIEYDGEEYPFEGEDAKDLLYGYFGDGYLTLPLGDDKIAWVIFWAKDGHEYGQSHIYSDWDNDGIADLTTAVLFTR